MKLTRNTITRIINEEIEKVLAEDLGGIDINELVTMLQAMAKMGANLSPLLLALVPAVRRKVEPLLDKAFDINSNEEGEE